MYESRPELHMYCFSNTNPLDPPAGPAVSRSVGKSRETTKLLPKLVSDANAIACIEISQVWTGCSIGMSPPLHVQLTWLLT